MNLISLTLPFKIDPCVEYNVHHAEAAVAGDVQRGPHGAETLPHSADPQAGRRPQTGHDNLANVLSL